MNSSNLSFSVKDPYIPKDNRWIASLSNGETVFEDKIPGLDSSWLRLRNYCNFYNVKITGLRLEAFDVKLHLPPRQQHYWYSSSATYLQGKSLFSKGIGYFYNGFIYAIWIREGGYICPETRPYNKEDLAVI